MILELRRGIAAGAVFASMIGLAAAGEGTITVAPSSVAVPLGKAGEIALAVVPPGKKTQCPGGRVLIANDELGPGWGSPRRMDGIVSGIDLLTGAAMKTSLHDDPPNPLDYQHNWSSDKNMVSLPNGDVIYQAPSFSKRPAASGANSLWFNSTFHFNGNTKQPDFGPGARSVQATWRSEDCGETFHYVGEADPTAFSQQGECAFPQPPVRQAASGALMNSMGGTDGPWLGVDRTTGALILTYGCVGHFSTATAPTLFKLGEKPKCPTTPKAVPPEGGFSKPVRPSLFTLSDCLLKKTYVVTSTSSGKDWTTRGVIDADWWMWRAMGVPLPQNRLAVGWGGTVFLGTPGNHGELNFKPIPGPAIDVGYDANLMPNDKIKELGLRDPRPSLLTRVPGAPGKVFLLVPDTFSTKSLLPKARPRITHGFKVYVVDTATGNYSEPKLPLGNIVPFGRSTSDLIMHLTPIDTGEGPILFYWYDVSTATKTATIRGRIYFAEDVMTDFVISKANGSIASFSLQGPAGVYGYRDYKMADGFRSTGGSVLKKTYEYFPTWVQPDGGGTAHFSRVTVTMSSLAVDTVKLGNIALQLSKTPLVIRLPSAQKGVFRVSPEDLRFLEQHRQERGPH